MRTRKRIPEGLIYKRKSGKKANIIEKDIINQ